ncbi:MAG TPA: META domain-containing protein [Burkholderiales bacterium]|nr:META domain-containing protein [Burkholderiales bacterium]
MRKQWIVGIVAGAMAAGAAHAGPREECAAAGAVLPCLDARLKEANRKLNATLKAAQEKLEQMQAHGRRPMMGAFVDSQRKFNAYRDAQCSWQGVRAAPGENTAEYVRECQLLETLARDELLGEFARSEVRDTAGAAGGGTAADTAPPPPVAEPSMPAVPAPQPAAPGRGNEWRLATWVVGGQEKGLLQDSTITIAFDPTGKVAGNATVNRFSGTYSFDNDGRLRWPAAGFALTRMAGPPALMAQERAFLESLRRTTLYKVDGQQLVLESANASVVLAFTR